MNQAQSRRRLRLADETSKLAKSRGQRGLRPKKRIKDEEERRHKAPIKDSLRASTHLYSYLSS